MHVIIFIENRGQGWEYQNFANGWVNFTKSAQYPTGSKEALRKLYLRYSFFATEIFRDTSFT